MEITLGLKASDLPPLLLREEIIDLVLHALKKAFLLIDQNFKLTRDAAQASHQRSFIMDEVLRLSWDWGGLNQFPQPLCLLAVGRYGAEQLPLSTKVEILVLHGQSLSEKEVQLLENFVQFIRALYITLEYETLTLNPSSLLLDIPTTMRYLTSRPLAGENELYACWQTRVSSYWTYYLSGNYKEE